MILSGMVAGSAVVAPGPPSYRHRPGSAGTGPGRAVAPAQPRAGRI